MQLLIATHRSSPCTAPSMLFGTVNDKTLNEALVIMKKGVRDNFKNNILVKPLYSKVRNANKIEPKLLVTVDTNFNLEGDGFSVKRKVVSVHNVGQHKSNKESGIFLPGACGKIQNDRKHTRRLRNGIRNGRTMLDGIENRISDDSIERKQDKSNKLIQSDDKGVLIQIVPNTWLRMYPLPKLAEESVCSVVLRCILCQLGLATILVFWTIVWVYVIHSFEGPYEEQVALDFEKEQNQLVIDLATELRQITPLSPRWKFAIEKRIEAERKLTLDAVSNGARVHPGQFWDLSGTFLFTIYVMTALGFGAPVPHTMWGRTSALSYAFIAVPTHVYLMLNASTCIAVTVETYISHLRRRLRDRKPFIVRRTALDNGRGSPECSRNSELLKVKPNRHRIGRRLLKLLGVFGAWRGVPLAALSYYACGAVAFGVVRGKSPLEVIMFPLEFTTSGGLDFVRGHVRILYGFYIEGAMMLIACALATMRRHSSIAMNTIADRYRLFACEH